MQNNSKSIGPAPQLTYSVPEAGRMAGLSRNASYAAARRGEIPTITFGAKHRVPAAKWKRILAEGRNGGEPT